jgi:ABC-type transporter Mla subunit MlaD
MGDSEFAAKDDLQSVRDVVYEHAQKLDELTQKIEDLSKKLDQLRPEDVVNDWSSLSKLLSDNSSSLGDLIMQTSSVMSKFNDIDSALSDVKSKVGS